jgi:hypothetical protein
MHANRPSGQPTAFLRDVKISNVLIAIKEFQFSSKGDN